MNNIEIVYGTGEGPTTLSAFDSALADGGIHNYNLVELSSVIPKDTEIINTGKHEEKWNVGDLVAVVLSENTSSIKGNTIAAGIGWATAEEGGVFFEITGENISEVEEEIKKGITKAKQKRNTWSWDNNGIKTEIVEHTVEENGSAMVSAIYRPL